MEYGILGPLEVHRGGHPVHLPAGGLRDLVALLAVEAGRPVSVARLVDALWGEHPPANPDNAVQQRVHHVRRLLESDGAPVVVTTPGGYLLDVPPERVDAHRFERLATEGRRHLEAGDAEAASRVLSEAASLWRGPALDGLEAAWARAEARRLDERRLAAQEDRVDADLALGRHAELVAELEQLVEAQPLRERARGQLMLALAGSGRQADALGTYDRARRELADELGIDPSPELQRIHADVLNQRVPSPRPPAHTPRPAAQALPAGTSSFVGRDQEVDRLRRLVSEERAVSLLGPGGAGKTRLAVEVARAVARDQPGLSVHLVELAPLSEPAAVTSQVAAAVEGLATDVPPRDAIRAALQTGPSLLLLDNCEHLSRAVAELVEDLLTTCPPLTVLATSREPLGVPGEVVWPVPPLPVPPPDVRRLADGRHHAAFQLFLDRAAEAAPRLALTDAEAADVARIVRHLDGIPLAIELAAARLRVLSVAEIADRLHDRFTLLTGGHRTAPDRHRALSATLAWSWSLLDDDQRRAWMAASVPAAPFPATLLEPLLEAAGADLDLLDAITALADRSLVTVHERGVPTRYRMLETLREFGAHELAASGREPAVRDAHAQAVEGAVAALDRCTPSTWDVDLDALRAWLPEARAAMRWRARQGDQRGVQRLAAGLGWLWYLTALAPEGLRWLDGSLGPLGDLEADEAEPDAVFWAAALRVNEAPEDHGLRWAQLAADLATDDATAALARAVTATHRAVAGDMAGAHADIAREPAHAGWVEGYWRLLEGQLHALEGHPADARPMLDRAERLLIDNGAWFGIWASAALVQLAQLGGDGDEVRRVASRALEVCDQHGAPELEVELRCALAMVEAAAGDHDGARRHLEVADAVVGRTGVAMSRAAVDIARGYARWRGGELDAARDHLRRGADLHDRAGQPFGRPFALWCLGHVTLALGDVPGAYAPFTESLRSATAAGEGDGIACAIEGLAAACAADDRHDAARRLLDVARARRQELGIPTPLLTCDLARATERAVEAARTPSTSSGSGVHEVLRTDADVDRLLADLGLVSPLERR